MGDWRCTICGFVYSQASGDPEHNVAPGTAFADVPDSWVCPLCGAGKDAFVVIAETTATQAVVVRRYANDQLTVIWQPAKCNHNGNCTRSLPAVFDTKRRPWVDINGAPPEDIRRVVEQCPTGALTWEAPAAAVTLREVTHETLREICRLQVSEYQNQFVAPNAVSVAEAYFVRDKAWFRAIYADETPVGFVMVYEDTVKPEYFLWRFMIDARYQKFGYGRKALQLVIDHVRTLPGAKEMKLSFHEADGDPSGFYRKLGFVITDEYWDDERVMVLTF